MRNPIRSALITITAAMLLGSGAALAASNACKADLTGDGVVNFGDLAVLKSVFFQTCPRFEDRGETVFDHQTGLEWEKKTDDGGIHDYRNSYTWSRGAPFDNQQPNGTVFREGGSFGTPGFLEAINSTPCVTESLDGVTVSSKTGCAGAGHTDWRLPTVSELNTILDCSFLETTGACINPIFGKTQLEIYCSSTSDASDPHSIWVAFFGFGGRPAHVPKTFTFYVRAVRGGL